LERRTCGIERGPAWRPLQIVWVASLLAAAIRGSQSDGAVGDPFPGALGPSSP